MNVGKYVAMGMADVLENVSYVWNQLLQAAFIGVIIWVFLQIWTAVYAGKPTIEGFTMTQMLWYLAFAEVLLNTTGNDFIEKIGTEVKNGTIGMYLLRPMHYLGREFSVLLINFIYGYLTLGVVAFIITYALVGALPVTITSLLFIVPILLLAAAMSFLIVMALGLSSFWFEDASSTYFIYQKIVFILGGMLMPLDMYPAWLQPALQYLPTTFMMYLPAKLFVHFSMDQFVYVLVGQLIWIVIILVILLLVYRAGVKEVTVHGG